jgi:hypothetical protein
MNRHGIEGPRRNRQRFIRLFDRFGRIAVFKRQPRQQLARLD